LKSGKVLAEAGYLPKENNTEDLLRGKDKKENIAYAGVGDGRVTLGFGGHLKEGEEKGFIGNDRGRGG